MRIFVFKKRTFFRLTSQNESTSRKMYARKASLKKRNPPAATALRM